MPNWIIKAFLSIILGVTGQLLFKEGATRVDLSFSNLTTAFNMLWRMLTNTYIFTGLVFYALSTVFWIMVLKEKDLSMVYPILSFSYVLVLLFSWLIRHEVISSGRWLGALIITLGVIIITKN